MEKFTGTCIIRVDGVSIRTKDKAQLSMGGMERTGVYADGQPQGYSEKPIMSKVTATCAHTSLTDMRKLSDATNATIIFETDTGAQFLINGAFATKPAELTGGEGDVSVEYMGQKAEPLT